jgi:Fe-S-cluster-containing hydrogenase component 2/CRP-like cAMP-binding protein
MTCISFYPRAATCLAATDEVECVEMIRSTLDLLKDPAKGAPKFRAQLEENYRKRALANHLRNVPLFANLSDEFLAGLRETVALDDCDPGETICKQGEPADAFFLIRRGFVKVTQNQPGGTLVLCYLGSGEFFGHVGLLGGGTHTATCTALDHVEIVKIQKKKFDELLEKFQDVRGQLWMDAAKRTKAEKDRVENPVSLPVDDFLKQGLINSQNVLLIDLDRCTRCDECVRACSYAHGGLTRLTRDGLRFGNYLVTSSCRSCTDPSCMEGCPTGAIRRNQALNVEIDYETCIGCRKCASQCPYGNIYLYPFPEGSPGKAHPHVLQVMDLGINNDMAKSFLFDPKVPEDKLAPIANKKGKALTCDLCNGLPEPSCVYACPHHAAIRVEPRRFFAPEFAAAAAGDADNALEAAIRGAKAG